MVGPRFPGNMYVALSALDPRRSLGAAAIWLIVALALTFSIAAAIWVGSIARRNVLEQHVRRLTLETDQLSTDLSQALVARLDAVRGAGAMLRAAGGGAADLHAVFQELTAAYPHLDWIAATDPRGVTVASDGSLRSGEAMEPGWLSLGLHGPWLGSVQRALPEQSANSGEITTLGDLSLPVHDESGRTVGVVLTRVGWRRAAHHPERLTDEPDPRTSTEICVTDRAGLVLVGPKNLVGRRWPGVAVPGGAITGSTAAAFAQGEAPRFERLPDGRRVLVSRSALAATDEIGSLGWWVQLSEPHERVYQRADALALRILWVSLCLGALTAALGILGAKHLTRRLRRLAASVERVGEDASSRIEVPGGADEVARLGHAFAKLLDDLALERNELERRVAVRTGEVERLADESRYAAIVRERLQIARDLHDTLAHSMMAMLSEIRLMRKLHGRDPQALARELARAETLAHEGLQEARNAITRMRVTAVRETGLGPALAGVFERFLNLSGLSGDFRADVTASRFGDERAETLVKMAREVLRNVERHAGATRVSMRLKSPDDASLELQIEDNGVGFDPDRVPPGHYGIVGLREQAAVIGARLELRSSPGHGTLFSVTLRVPPMIFNTIDDALQTP